MNVNILSRYIKWALLLIMSFLPFSLFADDWTYPTSWVDMGVTYESEMGSKAFGGGDGTDASPFIINTAQQLANMSYLVNNSAGYNSKSYKLGADIDLGDKAWERMGRLTAFPDKPTYSSTNNYFKGTFDGNHKTISGLNMNDTTGVEQGLFGVLSDGATVKNVTVKGNIITTKSSGGIAGVVYSSSKTAAVVTIYGCINYVDIDNQATADNVGMNCGGILGLQMMGQLYVDHCGNHGTFTGTGSTNSRTFAIIGLIGTSASDANVFTRLVNCYNRGKIWYPSRNDTKALSDQAEMTYNRTDNNQVKLRNIYGNNSYGWTGAFAAKENLYIFPQTTDKDWTDPEFVHNMNIRNLIPTASPDAADLGKTPTFEWSFAADGPVLADNKKYFPICKISIVNGDGEVQGDYYTDPLTGNIYDEMVLEGKDMGEYFIDAAHTQQLDSCVHFKEDVNIYTGHEATWSYPIEDPITPFESGDGTVDAPYIIHTAQQLANMAYLINEGKSNSASQPYRTAHYKVDSDIDLEYISWHSISEVTSFGTAAPTTVPATAFGGSFDGGHHLIKGLNMDKPLEMCGLFGCLTDGAAVKNVRVQGTMVSSEPVGGICAMVMCSAKAKTITIEGCINNVAITENGKTASDISGNAGGIVGILAKGTLIINNCGNIATLTSYTANASRALAIVGLVGSSQSDANVYCEIRNCYHCGEIIGISNSSVNSWGGISFQRTSTSVAKIQGNIYTNYSKYVESALTKNVITEINSDVMSTGELSWMLNAYELGDDGLLAPNYIWSTYDGISLLTETVATGHPTYRVRAYSTSGQSLGVFYTDSETGQLDFSTSVYKYFFDKECTKPVDSHVFDADNVVIYRQEPIVPSIRNSAGTLSVAWTTAEGYSVTDDKFTIDGTEYSLKYEWTRKKNNDEESVGTSSTLSGITEEYLYTLKITTEPASGYEWTLHFAIGDLKVYCDPKYKDENGASDGTKERPWKTLLDAYKVLSNTTDNPSATVYNQKIILKSMVTVQKGDFVQYTYGGKGYIFRMGTDVDDKPATITTYDGENDYWETDSACFFINGDDRNVYELYGDTRFEKVHISITGTSDNEKIVGYIVCQGWNLTIGEGVVTESPSITAYKATNETGLLYIKGTKVDAYTQVPNLHIVAGCQDLAHTMDVIAADNGGKAYPHDMCNVVINSGNFARIIAGGRNTKEPTVNAHTLGSEDYIFNVTVTVDIKERTSDKYDLDINQVTAGQTDGNCYINSTVNIKNGVIGRLIGGNISYSRQTSNNSATPDAISNSFFGSVHLNITGGTINSLYGQMLGRVGIKTFKPKAWFYGHTVINISGGKFGISKDIDTDNLVTGLYGASACGSSGYNKNSTDINREMGASFMAKMRSMYPSEAWDSTTVVMNISGGEFLQPLYGGGYGYSEYVDNANCEEDAGALNGNVEMNISGGTFHDNVFGGSRGTERYIADDTDKKLNSIAQINGNVKLNITGGTFEKNVYGGSLGVESTATYDASNMSQITGNVEVKIKGKDTLVKGNVYGGGSIAKVVGNTNVYLGGEKEQVKDIEGDE